MSSRYHLSAYYCGRAVGWLEAGQSVTTVAVAMGVSKSVISRIKKAAEGGNALQKHAGGRCRNTTPLGDRYVALMAKRNGNLTPGQIAANIATATDSLPSKNGFLLRAFIYIDLWATHRRGEIEIFCKITMGNGMVCITKFLTEAIF
ncbi:hypothetical protein HNY73_005463 [Argiope bruennichi]|uniref:Uncharacterized protein n=1 Tax=Argiope bruennichi TaxID=94029 RepID=A0A8T0FGN6_ARGBR|nr:hypothetical protein HNY73_005463 [Argiope bruennichi]